MAITLDLQESHFGVPFTGAYFRIVTSAITRTRNSDIKHYVMIDVIGYATQPQNEDTKDVDFRRYHVALDDVESQAGNTFLEKCYSWVMAQDDMAGSVAA